MENIKDIEGIMNPQKKDDLPLELRITNYIREQRKKFEGKNSKDLPIPEAIALNFDFTLAELEEKILNSKDEKLKREWALYREHLKVKFSNDKDTMKEMQNNYNLGIEQKSFPGVNFYFGNDVKEYQTLEIIKLQTLLQREKNIKEAESMGIKIVSDEERKKINEIIAEFKKDE